MLPGQEAGRQFTRFVHIIHSRETLAHGRRGFHTRYMRYLFVFSLLMLAPALGQAEPDQTNGTRVSLSATAEAVVANDEVTISFRVEQQGKDVDQIRRYVNRVTAEVKKRLEKQKDVKLETTSRRLQPVWRYQKNGERIRVGWQMLQSGRITSRRLDEVAGWLEEIETAGAHLTSLQFGISSRTLAKTKEELNLQALNRFRDKASQIAKGLAAESFRILRLSTDSQLPQPVVRRREMAMMAAAPEAEPPALSAGEGTVQVTVSGEIELPHIEYPVK